MSKNSKKVVTKVLFGLLMAVMVIVAIGAIILLTAGIKRVDASKIDLDGSNPFIMEQTLLSAHRAGGDVAPENTMVAFEHCLENDSFVVDTLEFDLHLTAEDQNGERFLVLLHDDTLDRTSNAEQVFNTKDIACSDKTLEQLKELNMGYDFEDRDGNYPYRDLSEQQINDAKLRIVTLEEIFDYTTSFTDRDLTYVIEIKDGDKLGEQATDMLYEALLSYNLIDKVVIGTFKNNVTEYIDKRNEQLEQEEKPIMYRSASIKEVLSFYFSFVFNVKLNSEELKYVALQIPFDQYVLNLGHQSVIDYAHYYNKAVQYWTINEEDKVKELVERGADMVMTDSPDIAYPIIAADRNNE